MAGLEGLSSIIYHEKQQSGSMLCAQHALNSLLQGAFFTAPDLSEIARKLDRLEEQYNTESPLGRSKNMDDTGFFSVQVIEEAMGVWGLNLVRWRSSAMQPYQDHPHTQLAFILNFEQHWFTLRRFGPASTNPDEDPGAGHWFNLNSFLPLPEWVGKLYLGALLQQAESEGYSVFVVRQADTSLPLALSRTEADEIAATLPEPRSASQSSVYNATKRVPGSVKEPPIRGDSMEKPIDVDELEDEDFELQAALQASLASQEGYGSYLDEDGHSRPPIEPPPLLNSGPTPSSSRTAASGSTSTTGKNQSSQQLANTPDHADLDPVAASMERNRVLLQRMREQQEFAQRELWSSSELTLEQLAIQNARRLERLKQEEEEEEQLKKVIAESEAMAREHQERRRNGSRSSQVLPVDVDSVASASGSNYSFQQHRNYEDEDTQLQAALKASLEQMPNGWQYPESSKSSPSNHREHHQTDSGPNNESVSQDMNVDESEEWDSESEISGFSDTTSKKGNASAAREQAAPNIDEMRLARLARFGS